VAHFNTGRPESGHFGERTKREGVDASGAPQWFPVDADAVGRLPPFFRLDLRASRSWVFDRYVLEGYVDIFNISARSETLSVSYTFDGQYFGQGPRPLKRNRMGVPVVLPSIGLKGSF
jgi:hypothetical protein